MNTTAIHLACAAAVLVAAGAASAQQAAPRLAIAVAGSPLIVPGGYVEGVLTRWDNAASTIVVDGVTYPVLPGKMVSDVSIGERVVVTVLVEHYGRAARRVALGIQRASP